jgi:hypothetical protein
VKICDLAIGLGAFPMGLLKELFLCRTVLEGISLFFDVLSIELQSKSYEEINPFLRDYVEDTLDNEYNHLPPVERFVLDHSECAENLECDIDIMYPLIKTANILN